MLAPWASWHCRKNLYFPGQNVILASKETWQPWLVGCCKCYDGIEITSILVSPDARSAMLTSALLWTLMIELLLRVVFGLNSNLCSCPAHRYHYRCVIHGWDEQCEMSDAWKQQMGVYNLRLGAEQPFYNVLVDDGSNRYASQGRNNQSVILQYYHG